MSLHTTGTPKKSEKKKFNLRLFLLSALVFVIIFTIYRVCIENEKIIIMWIYLILASCLFIAIFILNRGMSSTQITADMLPDEWGDEKKAAYLDSDKRRRRIAKYLIIPLIPLLFVFIYEIFELFYLDKILELLSGTAGK